MGRLNTDFHRWMDKSGFGLGFVRGGGLQGWDCGHHVNRWGRLRWDTRSQGCIFAGAEFFPLLDYLIAKVLFVLWGGDFDDRGDGAVFRIVSDLID